MPKTQPWYTRPWPSATAEPRWVIGFCIYLLAGTCGAALAIVSSRPLVVAGWSFFAIVFLGASVTLMATLRFRR